LSKELGYVRNISLSSQTLSKIYEAEGKFKDAFEMQKLFKHMSDSVSNGETRKSAIKQQMQYEFQQKEAALNAEQDRKDALAKEKEQRQKDIRNTFIGSFFLVLMLALFIFVLYRQKKIANNSLDLKNQKIESAYAIIEKQKGDVEQKNNKLQKLLGEKELLIREIHHRVKNNLQIISSLLSLQSNTVNDKNIDEVLKQSQSRVNTMAILHNKLYQTEDFSNVPIKEYLQQLISSISDSFNSEKCRVDFNINAEEKERFNIDTAIPIGLIINELVTNSFKHAFSGRDKGIINIKLAKINGNNYLFTFADNGTGIPENFRKKMAKSFGLELIEMLVQQLNGSLDIINKNGTTFEINFFSVEDKEAKKLKEPSSDNLIF